MSVHPAVSEAAMHVAAAHQRQHRGLQVAARIDAVHLGLPLAEQQVWASSLVSGSGSHQEQQLRGDAGVAMRMAGMETRRLVAQVRGHLFARLPGLTRVCCQLNKHRAISSGPHGSPGSAPPSFPRSAPR